MTNEFMFLKSQVKAFHPNWSDEQINAEVQRIINENNEDCLYCGS